MYFGRCWVSEEEEVDVAVVAATAVPAPLAAAPQG